MKTKTTFLSMMGLVIFSGTQLFSQSLYVNVGGGYGFGAAQMYPAYDNTSASSTSGGTYTSKIVKGSGSFGKGFQMGATFGYMFNKNIGAELNTCYLMGSKSEGTSKSMSSGNYYSSNHSSTQSITGNMLRFIPSIRMQVGNDKTDVYMRMGLVVGTAAKVTVKSSRTDNDTNTDPFTMISTSTTSTEETVVVYSKGVPLGFSFGIGFDYKLSSMLGIYGEAGMIMQSWAPKRSVVTKEVADGKDMLPSMNTSDKETDYVNEITENYGSGSTPNTSVPSKSLKQYVPFSSVGVNVGLRFYFGGKGKATPVEIAK